VFFCSPEGAIGLGADLALWRGFGVVEEAGSVTRLRVHSRTLRP